MKHLVERVSEREIITRLEETEDSQTDFDPPFKFTGANFIKAMLREPIDMTQDEDGVWRAK